MFCNYILLFLFIHVIFTWMEVMGEYRVYVLDRAGRIYAWMGVDRDTDDGAVEFGRTLVPADRDGEIWQLDRMVAKIGRASTTEATEEVPGASTLSTPLLAGL